MMPQLNFIRQGRGPVVVLAHALGLDLTQWDEVAPLLERHFTVLRYDQRGHGRSEVPPGPYTLEALVDDAAALVNEQVGEPVHFVGLSMGGLLAQLLASRHPELVRSVVIAHTSSWYSGLAWQRWRDRIEAVRERGMAAVADGTVQRWFTPAFHADARNTARIAALRDVLLATDASAYVATCEATVAADLRESNRRIACPALVMAGTQDESAPPVMLESIAASISGAHLVTLETAHLGAVERPDEFAAIVTRFIQSQ
jgi:3-oxoadipate enol-lactonase